MLQEPALDVEFEEDMKTLLEMDQLQGMATGDVHGALNHGHGTEGSSELVYLFTLVCCCKVYFVGRRVPSKSKPSTMPQPGTGTS